MADYTLDAQGLSCPLPILKAKKALNQVPSGGTLEVFTTDPGASDDFKAFCKATGNKLVSHEHTNGVDRFLIKNTS